MTMSIFFMFSHDRKDQFEQQQRCLADLSLYGECQKILVVDGDTDLEPEGFDKVTVPRVDGVFSWAAMWEAGVASSRHEVVLYLDSDRVLPRDYLKTVLGRIDHGRFLFCESMFAFKDHADDEEVKTFRDTPAEELRARHDDYKDVLAYDPRWQLPLDGPGKGPMSGNVAFTKPTWEACGGADPWYKGHGAYLDSDLHRQCHGLGMEFVDTGALELHLYHEKQGDSGVLTFRDVEVLSLNNYVYYCLKWNVKLRTARTLAGYFGFPDDFVDRVVERIHGEGPFVPLTS